jgi:hypothetical protein
VWMSTTLIMGSVCHAEESKRDVPEPIADPTGVWNLRYV